MEQGDVHSQKEVPVQVPRGSEEVNLLGGEGSKAKGQQGLQPHGC